MSEYEAIYLDYHATTPCDARVVDAMLPYFSKDYGNPSNANHSAGRKAAQAVDRAREQVAELINAQTKEIIFTSGATESNNLAIFGLTRGTASARRRIVSCAIEHKAVLQPCEQLRRRGFEVVKLPVDREGRVDMDKAKTAIDGTTLLVTIQVANNEIGTIQDIVSIAELARAQGVFIHTDAAQAVGRIPIDVDKWDVDLLSISGHKLYGPKGVGALFVRGGPYAMPLEPLSFGGGQEYELRPGTLNVPGIVGFGLACEVSKQVLPEEALHVARLRDLLEALVMASVPTLQRNGAEDNRLPGNSSLTFPGLDADALIVHANGLILSTGSACTSGALEPSHVLTAIGLSRRDANSTIRIGLGRYTTESDIRRAAVILVTAFETVQELTWRDDLS